MVILKILKIKFKLLLLSCLLSSSIWAQEGVISVRSNDNIKMLLNLKKEINKKQSGVRIQIFSGSRDKAEDSMLQFKMDFPNTEVDMIYETPSYKIWVGNYRTQIQADRALVEIRKKYSGAFSFTPKTSD